MGAWGTAIFSDDFACDVRDEFRDLIGNGFTAEEAAESLFREHQSYLRKFTDDRDVSWLALAETQWKMGRLLDYVRVQAIEIIDSGSNLKIWEESGDPKPVGARAAVLQKLKSTLESPQPVAKRHVHATNWKRGDLVSYRLVSGRLVIFRVIGNHTDRGGRSAVCELLDWTGDELPSDTVIRSLPIKVEANRRAISSFMLAEPTPHQRGRDRLIHLGRKSKPTQSVGLSRTQKSRTVQTLRKGLHRLRKRKPARTPRGYTVFPWKYLDQELANIFGLS